MPDTIVLSCSLLPALRFEIAGAGGTLGRSVQCKYVVNDSTVSRRHARIEVQPAGLQITDLGSRNGTFVNAERVTKCLITCGQMVQFGRVEFRAAASDLDPRELGSDVETSWKSLREENTKARTGTLAPLSRAQRRVFEVLLSGLAEKAIARKLKLSTHTVHNHVRAIFRFFDVHSRTELLAKYFHAQGK